MGDRHFLFDRIDYGAYALFLHAHEEFLGTHAFCRSLPSKPRPSRLLSGRTEPRCTEPQRTVPQRTVLQPAMLDLTAPRIAMIFLRFLLILWCAALVFACQRRESTDHAPAPISKEARQEIRGAPIASAKGVSSKAGTGGVRGVPQNSGTDASVGAVASPKEAAVGRDVMSEQILRRPPQRRDVEVQHILLSWSDLEASYAQRGGQDRRGAERSKDEADRLALDILNRARGGELFPALMRKYSEDSSTAKSGRTDAVTSDASLLEPFKELAMRLARDEIGVTRSIYGYHILRRIK